MHSHSPSVRPIRCLYARVRAGGLDKIAAIEQHGQGAVTDDFGEDDKSPGGRFSDRPCSVLGPTRLWPIS